ncbi:hypothetical protein [Zeimonas arvi]|uniref:Uncharacterized protein n=1 Tax=Zeimonas arvi TaxID=2498847 RepID=A0A5C8NMI1_9BURK|nr:hypothetical protein [Zeimonas arvi]TXL62462.1 hypothetical protein FHP08_18030 [Zeimonas arvi]
MENFEMTETGRGVVFALADGGTFHLPAKPNVERVGSLDVLAVARGVFDEAARLQAETKAVRANPHLTEAGKLDRLAPVRIKGVRAVARAAASVEHEDEQLAARENAIFTVPAIDRADAVTAIREGELRSRFASLTARARLQVVEEISKPGNEQLMLALLRDPMPAQDALREVVVTRWREAREAEHIQELRSIRAAREALDWLRRSIFAAAAAVRRSAELSPRELASVLAGDANAMRGAHAFGVSPDDIAAARAAALRRTT